MHLHQLLRNQSTTEPAKLLVFQAGDTGKAAPAIKTLLQEPLQSTENQELSVHRLTLPPGRLSEGRAHSGPGFVYVLEGKIETAGATYAAGDVFLEPAGRVRLTYRNTSGTLGAKLLVYQVNEKGGQSTTSTQ
jgi:quercetin dioxygenase-like cupin family protein